MIISQHWMTFLLVFAVIAKLLWFTYYVSLYALNPKKNKEKFSGSAALIVPVHNEKRSSLIRTIKSVLENKHNFKQVIFVDDGSKNDSLKNLKEFNDGSYEIIALRENMGKRFAHEAGVEKLNDEVDVIVFMDSDTIIRKRTIPNLLKYMNNSDIGAATAQVLVRNKNDNLITKSLEAFYWTSSNIWRKAPSNLGFMQVTNGQLSCYRAEFIKKLMPQYISQQFMGTKCTLSDDRFITHRIQTEFGKKIIYAEDSIAYTEVPNTIKGTYKMFKRWKLGSLRESILLFKSNHPILLVDVWMNHLVNILQIITKLFVYYIAFFYPAILIYYLASVVLMSLIFAFKMCIDKPRMIPYRILYSLMYEFIFSWVMIHAILTIKKQNNWGTRTLPATA